MKLLVYMLAFCIAVPVFGQRTKKKDGEEGELMVPAFTEGVVYSLPQTGVRVKVFATRTDFIPGPYARFADQLLGITDAGTEAGSEWVITDVSFETFSEPDPMQVFKAKDVFLFLTAECSNYRIH